MENDTAKHLVELAALYGRHLNLSHWRVSFLARGDGQFFKRLEGGGSCTLKTAAKLALWFADNWPSDLEWPRHIPRPAKSKREAA